MTQPPAIAAGLRFLTENGRLLERRLAELLFGQATVDAALGVVDALCGYRNSDGGLGHALEPDLRAPMSQPLAVDFGLEVAERVADSDVGDEPAVRDALSRFADDCAGWLAGVVTGDGGLPIVLPEAAAFPRAGHWGNCRFEADLNPTAGIVVRLRRLGARATWLETAERFCTDRIESAQPDRIGGHTLLNILKFLAATDDRKWADEHTVRLTADLDRVAHFHLYPGDGYGVTPLDIAPQPSDPLRSKFPIDAVGAHLEELATGQREDGGWDITWAAPGEVSTLEWRGVITLKTISLFHVNEHNG